MGLFQTAIHNIDLFAVGLTVAAIGILGFIVFYQDKKSHTNRAFLMLSLLTIVWTIFNYLIYQINDPLLGIWTARLSLFFAVFHSYYVFRLCYTFPEKKKTMSAIYKYGLLPLVFFGAGLTLTPYVFESIIRFAVTGGVEQIKNGIAMPFFGILVFALNGAGFVILLRKTRKQTGKKRQQHLFILVGLMITLALILVFNFILPAFFDDSRFVPFGPVFVFPFIICTYYAIARLRLLSVKIISTEMLTFLLAVALLFEIIIAESFQIFIYKIIVFVIVLFVGIRLIKSVIKEVEERMEIEKLAESLEKANIRLKQLDRQKTEFLSIASHQLRTPLSIIKGYLELVGDGAYGKVTKKTKAILANMDEANERLVVLVDAFLDITRIEQGRTKFTFTKQPLSAIVTSAYDELKKRGTDKGLKINWVPPADEINTSIDEEKIRHVVFNYIDNAIKYTQEGSVDIAMSNEDGGIVFRVKDTGLGFEKEDEVNFFQKFYRGKNVDGTNVNGTGLGIYVCKKFIMAHDGRVWGTSPGKGKGSEFGFWIPTDHQEGSVVVENTSE